jgi:hypothetical protein
MGSPSKHVILIMENITEQRNQPGDTMELRMTYDVRRRLESAALRSFICAFCVALSSRRKDVNNCRSKQGLLIFLLCIGSSTDLVAYTGAVPTERHSVMCL